MRFTFKITVDLLALAKHAVENHKWQKEPYTGDESGMGIPLARPEKPALLLVKDQGVYLMSPFTIQDAPPEARSRVGSAGDSKLRIVYANGHDPKLHKDWWVGGDDFAENLPGLPEMIVEAGNGTVTVSLTKRHLTYSVRRQ